MTGMEIRIQEIKRRIYISKRTACSCIFKIHESNIQNQNSVYLEALRYILKSDVIVIFM